MSKFSVGLVSIVVMFLLQTACEQKTRSEGAAAGKADSTAFGKALSHYTTYCSGCHGEQMAAFADREWKHGSSDSALHASISHGYPELGMPAFDSAFTDQEKKDLVQYIQSGIKNTAKYSFKEKPTSNLFKADSLNIRLDTVFSGVETPWSMAFLPGGDLLVTERSGKLYLVKPDRSKKEIGGVPAVVAEGQGGLFDVLPDPAYGTNRKLYLSYARGLKTDSGIVATTAVVRAEFDGATLKNVQQIFEAQPYWKTRHHYGGRMAFGPDGLLYITVGDRGHEFINPQSLEHDGGKVHRIRPDGTIPGDNPFAGKGGRTSVFSYGHRNPQGMAVHPVSGEVWTNEHGPRGGDEINIVKTGRNYGWPVITYGINYDGKVISKITAKEGMEQPLTYWVPSIAPSGMAFVTGERYKGWKDAVLVGSLRFKYLNLCYLDRNGKVIREETLLKNIGRLRDVRMGPDGYVYVAVEQPGYVFRLLPVQ